MAVTRCFVILPACRGAEAGFAPPQLLAVGCRNPLACHQHHLAPHRPLELRDLDHDLVVDRHGPRPGPAELGPPG